MLLSNLGYQDRQGLAASGLILGDRDMPMDPEVLYRELGQLVAEMPGDLSGPASISAETHRWLGRAATLIAETVGDLDATGTMDHVSFTSAADHLQGVLQERNAHQIVTILHRALARAERNAPAAAQGAFIAVGAAFTVFQVIAKILSAAKSDVLVVDAYVGINMFTDFVPLAPEKVRVRLLADSFSTKPDTLRPAVARWVQQYGAERPLETRLTASRLLHDRLIIVDGAQVWSPTQSLKDFGARSPGSVLRVDGEIATQKIFTYEQFWANAQAP